jgi:hypothetical protein
MTLARGAQCRQRVHIIILRRCLLFILLSNRRWLVIKWLLLYLLAFTFCTACTLFAIATLFSMSPAPVDGIEAEVPCRTSSALHCPEHGWSVPVIIWRRRRPQRRYNLTTTSRRDFTPATFHVPHPSRCRYCIFCSVRAKIARSNRGATR